MGGRILYRDSQGRDGQVELNPQEPTYVGRGLECAIRTDDAMVSRRHSAVRMDNGRYWVEDLGSANGTQVNNQRVSRQPLNHNDVVQCGSLWLRYVEDGPLVPPQARPPAIPQAGPAPGPGPGPGQVAGKKGGTMRIDASAVSGGGPAPAPPGPPAGGYGGYGNPPPIPGSGPTGVPHGGYGGPPAMPMGGGAPAMPMGGAPPMPMGGAPYGPPAMPMGGPGMGPSPGPGMGPPPMPMGGYGQMPVPPSLPAQPPGQSVVVDFGDDPAKVSQDAQRASQDAQRARAELEQLQANYDREVADGKRIRAEASTLRDRLEETRSALKDKDDQLSAHTRVADELRDELTQTRDELAAARSSVSEMADTTAAKERQLGRAQDDIAKLKEHIEEQNRQLGDVSRTKDEGWKKLNEQLSEIEHLREVINEQERMLEERRIGLLNQEEVIKELRGEKEKTLKVVAKLKAERDELVTNDSRRAAQMSAVDEENKRLGRLLVEIQSEAGRGGSTAAADQTLKLTGELRDVRVELRKVESDRDRLQESYGRAEQDVQKLEGRVAQLEVDLRDAGERRDKAESARGVAEEAMTKAEVARHKAAEQALTAAQSRDVASTGGDELRRENDRLKRRIAESEAKGAAAGPDGGALEMKAEIETLARKLREAVERATTFERTVKSQQAELDVARSDAKHARAEAEAAKLMNGGVTSVGSVPASGAAGDLQRVAGEVYDAINDILSELRQNVVLLQGEVGALKEAGGDGVRIMVDAVESLMGNAEDAKGALRGLRELSEIS